MSKESNRLVVITGASSGIGREMAVKFSRAGYPLLLIGRRVELMEELDLPNTMVRGVDVRDHEAFAKAIAEAEAEFGPTDLLINNAGKMLLGDIASQDSAEIQEMLDINLMGMINGIQAVLSGMKKRNHGTIINVASTAGIKTYANHAAYSATKFGVRGMTHTIREEVAENDVRVLLLSPGAVETELLEHTTDEKIKDDYKEWKKSIGEVLSAKEVADAVLFMYRMPQSVSIREVVMSATKQDN